MEIEKNKTSKTKNMKTSLIVFGVILFIIAGVYFYIKNIMPDHMLNQGKKYMEIGQYDKALKMFNMAADAKPYDSDPIYYQVLALSKLPPTYENQKKLFEIAQLEDLDEASGIAEKILLEMRKQLEKQIGPNYADNILYDDILVRWNNSKPITYTIIGDSSVPGEYYSAVKEAFGKWQSASNGQIIFKETQGSKNTNIVVNVVDKISVEDKNDLSIAGKTVPSIDTDKLNKMDIYIKKTDKKGNFYEPDKIQALAMHEIGHALGLGGHSAESEDIMYYSGEYINNDTFVKEITARDLNTLNLLYKMIPDVIDVPVPVSEYKNLFYHGILTSYPGENFEIEIQRLLSKLQDDRKNIIVWVDLAINYAYKKQFARSNHILHNILPLVQTDLQNQHVILYNLAVNYYKMKDYDSSAKYLALAENIQSDLDTQILGTFIDVRKDRIDLAEKKLNLLLMKYPENIEIALKLAEVYHIKKNKNAEKEVIDNLVKRNPKASRDRRVLKYLAKKDKPRPGLFK